MERLKAILKRIFFLPPLLTAGIVVPSFVLVGAALVLELPPAVTYLSYVLSAYALILCTVQLPALARCLGQGVKNNPVLKKLRSFPFAARLMDDTMFRAEVGLYLSLAANAGYVLLKLFSGIYYRSVWFISLGFYYLFLTVQRFLLLQHARNKPFGQEYRSELKRYRLCGWLLLVLNLALSGIVTLVVIENQGFAYNGYLIYVMAMYAFYQIINAVIQVVKFRKYNSPVLSASKVVSLTSAMVSMLSLETAMLAQFNPEDQTVFRRTMTATTGFAVCVIVLGMAIFMIRRASRLLKAQN